MSPIPVTIVTGFLGAGKTTLVNRLLRDPDFAETAVLINEFGDIQIDHDLVADFSDDLIMTTTGCLCCTATSDISKSLMEILEKRESGAIGPFKRVIVETTGLMDPVPVIATFLTQPGYDFEGGPLGGKFVLSRVVTLFDIINGPKTLDNHEEALKQVALCDLVLLTKTDMARDPATLLDITEDRKRILAINPGATILDSHNDWSEIRELFLNPATYDLRYKAEDAIDWLHAEQAHDHHHHDHSHSHDHHGHHHGQHHHGHHHHDHDHTRHGDDIRSHVIIADQPISPVGFSVFLDMVKLIADVDLLRLKGLVSLSDHPGRPLVVHGVQHLIHPIERLERWPSDDQRTKIVLIGRKLDVEALQTALKQFEATPQSDEII